MFALLQTCRAQCARRQRKPPTSPSTGWRLAQSSIVPYRKRPARAPHCRAAGRRHDDIEVVTQIGPVAEHLEFANIARSFNTDVLRHSGERLLAEWLAPQNHEHHIVRHEAQYSLQFAVCRSPAALAFIQVETRSRMAAASGDIPPFPSSDEDRSSIPVRNLAVALNEPGSEHGAKSTNRKERS